MLRLSATLPFFKQNTPSSPMARKRIVDLDFLRGLAILGVLFRHSSWDNNFARAGWAGVDLFFVLSGFLVSGLLFSEYKKSGNVRIGRFLIRRGFKIYPTFYLFLLVAFLVYPRISGSAFPVPNMLSEIFFVQSYFQGCFIHTWSLAIEEHFYLLLSLFIFIMFSARCITNKPLMISSLLTGILLVILFRLQFVYANRNEEFVPLFYTHLRMDGMLLGVLLAYLFYFSDSFYRFIEKNRTALIVLALALISPLFYIKAGGFFFNTIGFNLTHLGFGLLVIIAAQGRLVAKLTETRLLKPIINATAYTGVYSYSIYVWHLLFSDIIEKGFHLQTGGLLYLFVTITGGILLSLLIEQTFIKIRDRLFA